MAKKTPSTKKTTKKVTKKTAKKAASKKVAKKAVPAATKKKAVGTKKVAKKAAPKKAPAKAPAAKKAETKTAPAKKPAAKKAPAKKPVATKPVTKKPVAKKPVAKKAVTKKPVVKKAVTKKPVAKKAAGAKMSTSKPAASAKSEADSKKAGETPEGDDKKGARKGITIVTKKRSRRAPAPLLVMPKFPPLGAGLKGRKPLIPSGPKAAQADDEGDDAASSGKKPKSPFNKRQLEKFRQILLDKRRELFGDVSMMEKEALKGGSGSLSNLPQHMAEQGSDAYDQSLSLDLAAADRRLIKEIDDALERINNGTYGLCERSKKPIRAERLEELPWARYSIEAAREFERQSYRP